ncbi:MAG: DegV family protein [Chloroflexi bacterium]|jgi:DegV family protein with EDD domain|nr:DegV family protein [Anaerolineaceae bacterium]NMB87654.1 DegV family protein [Chloroflexota bacterium]
MGANTIALITDSTCDIPQSYIDQYGITVLPHTIIWDSELYRDRVDLSPQTFYDRLARGDSIPTTSQASVNDYLVEFQHAIERGVREIIVVTLSSAMSGAYQSAINAARMVNIPVHVVDSKGVTMSLGWQVMAAAREIAAGSTVKAILEKVEQVRKAVSLYVSMDTLKYVAQGGRIGNAARLIGTLLDIKPLVYIDHETGIVEAAGTTRTYKKVVELMYQKFFKQFKPGQALRVAVMHGNAREEAEHLAERITEEFHPVELVINLTGPVLGINTGPRALALAGYAEGA